jgi:predicted nucleic acid-binding protein
LIEIVVVDTDVVSYIFKQDTRATFYEPLLSNKDLMISFVTLAELQRWAIAHRWGRAKRQLLAQYLNNYYVFHSDADLCQLWAEIIESGSRKGRPIQPGDAWIAATALLHDTPLFTHNSKDYAGVEGLTIISATNP